MADAVTTRLAWQALAEHILSAARFAATGHIGLRPTPGGVGTPFFRDQHGERRIRIVGTELVIDAGSGRAARGGGDGGGGGGGDGGGDGGGGGGGERRAPITSLAAAGQFAGITPGAPRDLYAPSTPLDLERDLGALIDPAAADGLAAFYELAEEALTIVTERHAADGPAEIQLWPEHFDLATSIGEVNVGASPGDAGHDEPYFYVGPWTPRRGPFWNESFGASRPQRDLTSAADAAAFLEEGLRRAAADPPAS